MIDLNHVNELISIRDAFGMSNDLGLDNLKATIQVEFGDQGICSRNSSKGNSNCNDKQRHHTKSPVTRHIQKNVKKTTPIYLKKNIEKQDHRWASKIHVKNRLSE